MKNLNKLTYIMFIGKQKIPKQKTLGFIFI